MKQFLIFIGGMVAGALLLYAIGFRSESSVREQLGQELIEKLSHNLASLNQEAEIQYIEVKGKNGNVTLHTGMPKDSVQILVGKPDEVRLNTYGSSTHEDWGYKINNKYGLAKEYQTSDLDIEFENGKLKGVRQD
jgi:osmotically-inducible protein OsmY